MRWTVHLEGGPRRVNHAATVGLMDGHIYTFGGYCTGDDYKAWRPMDVHMLNTDTYRWKNIYKYDKSTTKRKSVPCQRYGHSAVAHREAVYIWGGRNDRTACNKLFRFNTRTRMWDKPAVTGEVPGACDGHSACVIGDRMYVFGGFEDMLDRFSQDVHVLDLGTMVWSYMSTQGTLPMFRDFHTATAVGDRMYVWGGRGDTAGPYHSRTELYFYRITYLDVATATWHQPNTTGETPTGRRSHSAFLYNNALFIFGGYNGDTDTHYNDLFQFDFEREHWKRISPLGVTPCERRRQVCLVADSKMYLFGGTSPMGLHDLCGLLEIDEQGGQRLQDHSDLHVLDFEPTLMTLSVMSLVESRTPLPLWLPNTLKTCINNMTVNNNISLPMKPIMMSYNG